MELNFYDYDGLQPKVTPPKHFSRQCSIREKKSKHHLMRIKDKWKKARLEWSKKPSFLFFISFFSALSWQDPFEDIRVTSLEQLSVVEISGEQTRPQVYENGHKKVIGIWFDLALKVKYSKILIFKDIFLCRKSA